MRNGAGFTTTILVCLCSISCASSGAGTGSGAFTDAGLADALRSVAWRRHVPALAAAFVDRQTVGPASVVGTGLQGRLQPVGMRSLFNIGSVTKSMTAVILGSLVS